uniref:SWIM-type domain-containing protein n=1 Tax=Panagrolaimus sp. JU765 TaxID=591449 RepID=A0AC34QHR8_9BILA
MALDSLVEAVTTYNTKSPFKYLYAGPYLSVYALWLYLWLGIYGRDEHWDIGIAGIVIIALIQVLLVLFCYWFVSINCLFTCVYVKNPKNASCIRVDPTPNNGWSELVPLKRANRPDGTVRLWFVFQEVVYNYDDEKKHFASVEYDTNRPFSYYKKCHGLESDEQLANTRFEYGSNKMVMKVPLFSELFIERATAPFFVFQVFCVGLWCLEDMWYYSLFTLMMLVTFEATIVKQQLRNMSEIYKMGNKPYDVNVYRGKKWVKISTDNLVCGDIVSIGRLNEEVTIPCDLLLLKGHCIVDESMLTGESIPQMKESIEEVENDRYFDFNYDGKLHVIYGGTKIVQHTPPSKETAFRAPDGNCVCCVLRTGFNTSQGSLLRTIMFGVKRVTANNLETFGFIVFLLIFAIAAAAYLWIKGTEDESRSRFKLFLECSLILTSVIPPELPIELSLAVNNSLIALQKLGVYCTEPFRIPFAGKVDICCFDKTGTLTTDKMVMEGIAGFNGYNDDGDVNVIENSSDIPEKTTLVLAGCQSLVRFEDELVGDPLEKACLAWINWNVSKSDFVLPSKGKLPPLKIVHRYHFSSQLRRMTVVASYNVPGISDLKYLALVKGAPEVLRDMYETLPDDYDKMYQKLALLGARILALGMREITDFNRQDLRDRSREFYEEKLQFAGFVVIRCPLKPDTRQMIREIVDSSHRVVMITGDNPLTACHVGQVLRFTSKRKNIFILDIPEDDSPPIWKSMDGSETLKLIPENRQEMNVFLGAHEFCLTGAGFSYLISHHHDFLKQIIVNVRIFARMSPKQKEKVINLLKALGYITLMCGDGTNDVGALKHANVGVALLSHPYDATKKNKKEPEKSPQNGVPTVKDVAPQKPMPAAPIHRRGVNRQIDNRLARHQGSVQNAQNRLENLMRQLEEEEAAQVIKLGDASIAAPFTSKYTSIQSICHIIKQGRCTLVTTLQMFKILALNALVLAYSQSVLYLDGVKFSDSQATIQGLLLAACFLFISRSRPLKTLSKQRPVPNIFNAYTLLTVTLQFLIHFSGLLYIVQEAHRLEPRGKVDLQAEFTPNLLNTAVYVMSMALQVATFATNYRGRPFMESLTENKPMLYSVVGSGIGVFALAANLMPELNEQIQLVQLPDEFRYKLVCCVLGDFVATYAIDRILNYLLGDMRALNRFRENKGKGKTRKFRIARGKAVKVKMMGRMLVLTGMQRAKRKCVSRIITQTKRGPKTVLYAVFERKCREVVILIPDVNYCPCRFYRHLGRRDNRITSCPHILAILFAEAVDIFGKDYHVTKRVYRRLLAFQAADNVPTFYGFNLLMYPP